jgi:site-specific DNA recombinase
LQFAGPTNSVVPSSDSTPRGVSGIDSRYMKRAALYARVSTDAQQKEATIESQLFELKKHIESAGHALVKEYIDDGYSGTQLDRPALEQLRADLKTDLFDVIYFHSADRIARDAAHQILSSASS